MDREAWNGIIPKQTLFKQFTQLIWDFIHDEKWENKMYRGVFFTWYLPHANLSAGAACTKRNVFSSTAHSWEVTLCPVRMFPPVNISTHIQYCIIILVIHHWPILLLSLSLTLFNCDFIFMIGRHNEAFNWNVSGAILEGGYRTPDEVGRALAPTPARSHSALYESTELLTHSHQLKENAALTPTRLSVELSVSRWNAARLTSLSSVPFKCSLHSVSLFLSISDASHLSEPVLKEFILSHLLFLYTHRRFSLPLLCLNYSVLFSIKW